MTPDLIWMLIIANAVIAAVTIANTWMLAWYNKTPRKKPGKPETEELQPRKSGGHRGTLCAIMFLLSIVTLAWSMFLPNPDTNIQILQVTLSIGFAVLAIVLSLISPMVEIVREQGDAILRLTELATRNVQSLPEKSPLKSLPLTH